MRALSAKDEGSTGIESWYLPGPKQVPIVFPGTSAHSDLQKMIFHPSFDILGDQPIQQLNNVETAYAKRNNIADSRTLAFAR